MRQQFDEMPGIGHRGQGEVCGARDESMGKIVGISANWCFNPQQMLSLLNEPNRQELTNLLFLDGLGHNVEKRLFGQFRDCYARCSFLALRAILVIVLFRPIICGVIYQFRFHVYYFRSTRRHLTSLLVFQSLLRLCRCFMCNFQLFSFHD